MRKVLAAATAALAAVSPSGRSSNSECEQAFESVNARRSYPLDSLYIAETCERRGWQSELAKH